MSRVFKFKSKVWLYPGTAGWHFVNLNKNMSAQIRAKHPKGFVRIQARIGDTTWTTSLFPHQESETYLLSIKSSVRKKQDIWEGDEVTISFVMLQV